MKKIKLLAVVLAVLLLCTVGLAGCVKDPCKEGHTYVDGVCSVCGEPDPDFATNLATAKTTAGTAIDNYLAAKLANGDYYSPVQKAEMNTLVADAKADVATATTTTGINTIVAEGKTAMDAIVSATYTEDTYMGALPTNFNPHTWETDADNLFAGYCEPGFVDIGMAVDKDGKVIDGEYAWYYEMATAITDITDEQDKAFFDKWGIEYDEDEEGNPVLPEELYVYKLTLNPLACWEDGTPINADTYMYSMQQYLNPAMKNYRANNYWGGSTAIAGAYEYYMAGSSGLFNISELGFESITAAKAAGYVLGGDDATKTLMLDLGKDTSARLDDAFGADVAFLATYAGFKIYEDGVATDVNWFKKYEAAIANPIPLTQEMIDDYNKCTAWKPDADKELPLMVTAHYTFPQVNFDTVGLVKTGEYELVYVNANPVTMFYFQIGMSSNWIVYEDIYEAQKETTDTLVTTKYGTTKDTYVSFGPYKLASFEDDKGFTLVQNEKWFGWTDGKHNNQYQTTHIKCQVLSDQNTILQMFEKGELDGTALTADDMSKYGYSSQLLKTTTTYTFRFFFNTDLDDLKAIEKSRKGDNVTIMYFDEFREGLSFAINRAEWAQSVTAGHQPSYALLNSLYYYNVEVDPTSVYRNTPDAKQGICNVYGIEYGADKEFKTLDEAFNSITGYDLARAKECFQAAYDKALAAGLITADQKVSLEFGATAGAATDAYQAQNVLLQQFVDAATKGTSLEGKVKITYIYNLATRYDDVYNGVREAGYGAWGGAAFYPFSSIRVYTDPDYVKIHEAGGFDPTSETVDITFDFDGDGTAETVTKTYQMWAKSINSVSKGGQYVGNMDACLKILSSLEQGILSMYSTIPVTSEADVQLYSYQLKYATTTYNIMYGYGGMRFLTYNYTDAEWAEVVAKQPSGKLNYT